MSKRILPAVLCLLWVTLGVAQEIAIRPAWNINWRGNQVRTSDNCVLLVWEDNSAGDYDIYAQKINSSGQMLWTSSLPVIVSPGAQKIVDLIETSDGNYVVLWQQEEENTHISVWAQKISGEGQLIWQDSGVPISSVDTDWLNARCVANTNGGVFLTYLENGAVFDNSVLVGHSIGADGSQLWQPDGAVLGTYSAMFILDSMVQDGEGGFIVDVYNYVQYDPITQLTRFSAQGSVIGNNPLLPPAAFPGARYSIMSGTNGEFILYNTTGSLKLQKMDREGNLLLSATVEHALDFNDSSYYKPLLALTAGGGLVCAWQRYLSGNIAIKTQLFNFDFEQVWQNGGVVTAVMEAGEWVYLSLSVNTAGGVWIAWYQVNEANTWRETRAQLVSASGTPAWGTTGLTLSASEQAKSLPVAIALNDRAIFVWEDQRETQATIRRQVIGNDGALYLEQSGIPFVSYLNGVALLVECIALDDSYFVLWSDTREGKSIPYYQILDADMQPTLEAFGRALYSYDATHMSRCVAIRLPDNNVAVLYSDYSQTVDSEYYLQQIDSQGQTVYPGKGILIESNWLSLGDIDLDYSEGDIYIGWTTYDLNDNFYLKGQRISNGQKMWGQFGRILVSFTEGFVTLKAVNARFYTWKHYNPANQQICRTLRFDQNGNPVPGWPAAGLDVIPTGAVLLQEPVNTGLLGNDLVVIINTYPSPDHNYMQKISPDGERLWQIEGVSIPTEYVQDAIYDDTVTLVGLNTFPVRELRLQKVSADGGLLYGSLGNPIASGFGRFDSAKLVRYASGYLTCSWAASSSLSDEEYDVFARHIDPLGEAVGAGEIIQCSAPLAQWKLQSGVIGNTSLLCWSDFRAGDFEPEGYVSAVKGVRLNSADVASADPGVAFYELPILHQNNPNPFNPSTGICFDLPEAQIISLDICNIKGQLVKKLCCNEPFIAGSHTVNWDGTDLSGNSVGNGIYLYSLRYKNKQCIRKMVLAK